MPNYLLLFNKRIQLAYFQKRPCSCSDYYLEIDCISHYCDWDETSQTCSRQTCSSQTNEDACNYIEGGYDCYWNTSVCLDRPTSSCSSLLSETQCGQVVGCMWLPGDICAEWSEKYCDLYSQEDYPARSWGCICQFNKSQCEAWGSCSILDVSACEQEQRYCEIIENQCVTRTCSSYSDEDDCSEAWDYLGYPQEITPCYWNNGTCTNATLLDLNSPALCNEKTYGYYRWSSTNPQVGSCETCTGDHEFLLQIIFALILLLQ